LTPGGINGSILTVTNLHTQNLATTLVASIVTPQGGPIIISKPIFADNDNGTYSCHQAGCWPYGGHDGDISIGQSKAMNVCNWMRVYVGDLAAAGKTVSLSSHVGSVNWYYDGVLNIHFDPSSAYATFTISGQEGSCSQGNITFYSVGIHRMEFDLNPNPVSDVLTINASLNQNLPKPDADFVNNLQYTTKVINLNTGMVVRTIQSSKGSTRQQINMSDLTTGYYVIEITEGDQVQSFKILKQ
ncbi:MAG: T9SS type A sorting domain-containing protein, partial [Ferruginibacter sp.]